MAGDPGVVFALVLNGAVLLVAVVVLSYWYWSRDAVSAGRTWAVQEWYATTAALARELREESDVEPGVNPEAARSRLLPLSYRLRGHVRRAPADVDEDVLRRAYTLAMDCYRFSVEHTLSEAARTGVFIEDKLNDVASSADTLAAAANDRTSPDSAGGASGPAQSVAEQECDVPRPPEEQEDVGEHAESEGDGANSALE